MLIEFGFQDADDSVPWREAFPEYTEEQSPCSLPSGCRRKEGLTQKELAAKSGIPQAHISLMERSKVSIGVTRAKRLAAALN